MKGLLKLAVLRGDPLAPDLLMGMCVDQRPFYIMSMAAEEVTWVVKTRRVYSPAAGRKVPFCFLHWSLSHTYNYERNDNDIAGLYCLIYRMMRFQRKTKWWWALFLSFWENSLTNTYHLMKSYYKYKGIEMNYNH